MTPARLIPEKAVLPASPAVRPFLCGAVGGGEPLSMSQESQRKSTLDYALAYIERGWFVLPLLPGKKQPAGGLVPNGFHNATNDPEVARAWWAANPACGIGIAVKASGLVVVDIDPRNGGLDTMEALEARHGALVSDVLAYTGGGGEHRVFLASAEGLPGTLGPGVDLKSDGYICVEPTIHPSGEAYAWEASSDPLEGAVPSTLPGWVRDLGRNTAVATSVQATRMVDPKQVAELRDALDCIPADDYHQWVNFGQALVELGQEGFKLWDAWSQKSTKYNPQAITRKWRSFKGGAYQLESIFHEAQQRGWLNPAKVFPVLEVEPVMVEAEDIEARAAAFEQAKQEAEQGRDVQEFLQLPGPMGECMAWMLRTAQRPQPLLAMAATLSLFSTVLSHKICSPTRLRTNLYLVGVAGTASGKDHGRKCLARALQAAGLDSLIGGDEIASGAGLLSRVAECPRTVFQLDEFGLMLQMMRSKNAGAHLAQIMQYLMKLYGSTDSIYRGAEYGDRQARPRKDVEYPCVNLHATTTPDQFFAALGSSDVTSGALNRLLVIVVPEQMVPRQEPDHEEVPESVVKWIEQVQRLQCGMAGMTPANPVVLNHEPASRVLASSFADWLDEHAFKHREAPQVQALWGRAYEFAIKLAMLHSMARHTDLEQLDQRARNGALRIGGESMRWGIAFVHHFVGRMEQEVMQRMGDSEFDIIVQNVVRVVRAAGPRGLTGFEIGRKCHAYKAKEPRYQDNVHVAMTRREEAFQVKFAPTGVRGKPRLAWVAAEFMTDEQHEQSGLNANDANKSNA